MNEWIGETGEPQRPTWWERRRRRKQCFHHDHGGNPANTRPAVSWIKQQIIETGKAKMFWCDEKQGGCGKTWFT
jgi:hypothetical protein